MTLIQCLYFNTRAIVKLERASEDRYCHTTIVWGLCIVSKTGKQAGYRFGSDTPGSLALPEVVELHAVQTQEYPSTLCKEG